jgi:CBS domain containing-hemolysin-like protein
MGDVVRFSGYEFRVEDMSGPRVTRVRASRIAEDPEDERVEEAG